MTCTFTFFFTKKPFWVYVIAFFSVFQTAVAQAPTIQASDIVFTNITETTATISWKPGNGNHRAVFMRKGTTASPNAMPVDNVYYRPSPFFGSGSQIDTSGWYCVAIAADNNMVSVGDLTFGAIYQVQVLDYYNDIAYNKFYLRTTNSSNPAALTIPNNVATLSNLSTSDGIWNKVFSSRITDYWVTVSNAVSSITVTPVTTDSHATVKVNGVAVASGNPSQVIGNLQTANPTTITIEVTAKDGAVKKYMIDVIRFNPSPTIQASNLTFTNTTATGTRVQWTNGSGNRRMVLMHAGTADIPVLPNKYFLSDTVYGMGDQIGASGWYVIGYYLSTNETEIKGLDSGEIYQVMVVELNGDHPAYPVYLTTTNTSNPATVTTLSNIATLSNLSLSAGALTPGFASGTTAYIGKVAHDVNSITVTPVTSDTHATVKVNGTAVASGKPSQEINLAAGTTTAVTIEVTAQDGTAKTYKLTVEKNSLGVVNTEIEGFVVYPNPVPHGRLHIQTGSAVVMEVELFDLSGKKVFSVQTTNKEVPIEGLQKGVYILKVRQDGAVSTEKIIVQ